MGTRAPTLRPPALHAHLLAEPLAPPRHGGDLPRVLLIRRGRRRLCARLCGCERLLPAQGGRLCLERGGGRVTRTHTSNSLPPLIERASSRALRARAVSASSTGRRAAAAAARACT